jgi:asparagine synthase (glutamine-hydrolysing)
MLPEGVSELMCGIVGMVSRVAQREPEATVRCTRALASIRHRGPDARGEYQDSNVWLGHARLSIIDLSSAGNQPMHSRDGRFVIAYNGEAYNFRELAAEHAFTELHSGSDTEVVLELFAKLGTGALARLNGMFAFCVYDRLARRIWLARDRVGIKPLYYRIDSGGLTFASEIKALLALSDEPRRCDAVALHEWLYYGNALGGRTLYCGIRQLLPGHCLELDVSSWTHDIREFWSIAAQAHSAARSLRVARRDRIADVRQLLEQAVRRQLVSDVPVGVFLSGGVDSSAIAAFASRHYAGRLATYSVGFDFATDGGELPKAKRVAALYGTDHHEIDVRGGDVADLVEKMVHHHDLPFADAANIPLYLMAVQVRDQTKVVLQGDGGDELFGGYRRYASLRYYRLLHPVARALRGLYLIAPKSPLRYRLQRYLDAFAAEDVATTMALLLTPEDRNWTPEMVFSPATRHAMQRSDAFARYRELSAVFAGQDVCNKMSFLDMCVILPDTYLEKVDRATMAASLEVRVPFLDNDLVDYLIALPGWSKMPWGRKKWLLKSALRGIVPDEILFGPKTGFNVPFGRWLQSSLRGLFFDHLDRFARARPGVLNVERVRTLFARTRAGRQDHSPMLWKILNFVIWANRSQVEFS